VRAREGLACAVLVAVIALFAPQTARAATKQSYSPASGFRKARHHKSITVWKPEAWGLRLNAALRAWNRQAGWSLFERARNSDRADVELLPLAQTDLSWDSTACSDRDGAFDLKAAYDRCTVYLGRHGPSKEAVLTLEHELGHTLGFVDHVNASLYQSFKDSGLHPLVCDDPSHPADSPYDGIMSYCQFHVGVNVWDSRLLELKGYT
jgi:hypothetical protein